MTEEMFMQLLDMAAAAGEGGFFLVVMYMLLPVFGWVLTATSLVYVIIKIVNALNGSSIEGKTMHEAALELNCDWYSYMAQKDARIFMRKLKELKENQK